MKILEDGYINYRLVQIKVEKRYYDEPSRDRSGYTFLLPLSKKDSNA